MPVDRLTIFKLATLVCIIKSAFREEGLDAEDRHQNDWTLPGHPADPRQRAAQSGGGGKQDPDICGR
jgi:hypothetical protein